MEETGIKAAAAGARPGVSILVVQQPGFCFAQAGAIQEGAMLRKTKDDRRTHVKWKVLERKNKCLSQGDVCCVCSRFGAFRGPVISHVSGSDPGLVPCSLCLCLYWCR